MSWYRWAAAFLLLLATSPVPAAEGELWLRATVNHVDRQYTALTHTDSSGRHYVRELDLGQLGIRAGGGPTHRFRGEWYYQADALPAHEVYVDGLSGFVHFVDRLRPHISDPPSPDLLMDVTVNQRRLEEPLLLHFVKGEIVFSESALVALGVNAARARLLLRADDALPIHAIAGENFAVDYRLLTLHLSVPPDMFLPVSIGVKGFAEPPGDVARGVSAILSYNVTSGISADDTRWDAGLVDLAIGSGKFTCSSQHFRPAYGDALLRLDSFCVRDWPESVLSLNIGDAITRPGLAGQAVRYGGVRIGTNYGLAPYYLTQPSLALLGSARVPSTLEVWVDQMLALRREVPPGVFELTDIPVHTGAGEVRAVVTNALGVREVISQPFYSDPSLLAAGLSDWSFELGRVRENYALPEDEYGERFGLLDYRYGVTDWLTVTPRLEAFADARVARLGMSLRVGRIGVIQGEHASSDNGAAVRGSASALRFSRRGRYITFALSQERSDENFVQLGYPAPGDTPAETSRASIGTRIGPVSLNVGGFRRILHDGSTQRFHTAAATIPIGRFASLLLTAFEPVEPADERLFSINLTMPLGRRSNVSANSFQQGTTRGWELATQRNLPTGPGFGYRVAHGEINDAGTDSMQLYAQGGAGRIGLDARRTGDVTAGHAELSGSIIASRHGLDLSRRQAGSVAVIELPSQGVRIYHDERVAAVTDSDGIAVVPGLRPYETNRLRVEIDDLSLESSSGSIDQRIVPGRRQAVAVDFNVTESRWMSATLWQAATGEAVPAGAELRVQGSEEIYAVGYEGFVYVPITSGEPVSLRVTWPGGDCRAILDRIPKVGVFVDGGAVSCQ